MSNRTSLHQLPKVPTRDGMRSTPSQFTAPYARGRNKGVAGLVKVLKLEEAEYRNSKTEFKRTRLARRLLLDPYVLITDANVRAYEAAEATHIAARA